MRQALIKSSVVFELPTKTISKYLVIFGSLLSFLGCELATPEREYPTLNIGVVLPLSGSQATYGEAARRGLLVAESELRQLTPNLSRRITLLFEDDRSLASQTSTQVTALRKRRAHLIIGSISAAASLALAEEVGDLPLIIPVATNETFSNRSGVYPVAASESLQGRILANYAVKTLGAHQGEAIYSESGIGHPMADAFVTAFNRAGGESSDPKKWPVRNSPYLPLHFSIPESPAVTLVSGSRSTAHQFTEARMAALSSNLMANSKSQSQAIGNRIRKGDRPGDYAILLGGESLAGIYHGNTASDSAPNGLIFSQFSEHSSRPKVRQFVKSYRQTYGRAPGSIEALAFDAYNLAADVLKRSTGHQTRELNRAFLQTSNFEGVTGRFTYEATGLFKEGIVEVLGTNNKATIVAPAAL